MLWAWVDVFSCCCHAAGHEIGEDSVQIYREVMHPRGEVIYHSKHAKHEGAGPLHGQPVLAPYPKLEGLQQKRLAARRHKTTYAYDFPTVFGNALRELWTARAIAGEPGVVPKGEPTTAQSVTGIASSLAHVESSERRAGKMASSPFVLPPVYQTVVRKGQCLNVFACPGRLVEVEELVMPPGGNHTHPKPIVAVNRPVGQNDVGMIAWTLTLKTPECPQGRKVP
jgi:acetyl-CoA carboxylase/biotin carboxylase 1